MSWVGRKESIATVSGTDASFSVAGHAWGRCKVTSTTVDGGYTGTINVDVGSLTSATTITQTSNEVGSPSFVLTNVSAMNITQIRFQIVGFDGEASSLP